MTILCLVEKVIQLLKWETRMESKSPEFRKLCSLTHSPWTRALLHTSHQLHAEDVAANFQQTLVQRGLGTARSAVQLVTKGGPEDMHLRMCEWGLGGKAWVPKRGLAQWSSPFPRLQPFKTISSTCCRDPQP